MKNNINTFLIIPDLHFTQKRENAINTAIASIFSTIKDRKFTSCILLGDLANSYPNAKERVMIANFLNKLKNHCEQIILIKGTDTHEYNNGIYNYEDITVLTKIKALDRYDYKDYIFGHWEVRGTKYINGFNSQSKIVADKDKKYILGHIHSPQLSFNNVTYVGSIYKVTFAEMNDTKRICILNDDKLESYAIESQPMLEINLVGKEGKVKGNITELKLLKDKIIDLKIKVKTDTQSLGEIHRTINKIKKAYKIEYYIEEISVDEVKTDIPKDLDQKDLLKDYCKQRKIDYTLVSKEI